MAECSRLQTGELQAKQPREQSQGDSTRCCRTVSIKKQAHPDAAQNGT